ncbi:MAG: LLM class F420-dependent oxidoreductase [Gammaproteobacteria bacterium]|nr:LLM class F420-dependent oxidoreductase [Gammaproteobacteria bacterium]MXY04909.1 LLM class F420-dependent oxidoreductase [Gammaproteobacteria bacterium]MYE49897.1 LLM class F420-dependent oxidoreductase [Gammaproteobacteria bacterium]MYF11490.1 LLM class F420-dependent oxidoreductase [Gammaproteobacteria bacterium]MYG12692.1 LLM class F420-dependent oxidoreductase [Gammaproteobacteria bacterium]
MKLGLVFPQTEIADDPIAIRDFARTAEAEGFDYLLAYDHVLGVDPQQRPDWDPFKVLDTTDAIETDSDTKRAPYNYKSAFQEPMVLFAYLAAVTERIEMATGVVILPQRQTALVAKQAANVANLSSNRLRLGVGIGWNDAEYEALGMNFRSRGHRIEEQIDTLRRLWREDAVTFKGDFDHLRGVGINPRPRQPIPLWLGGLSEVAMKRAARIADGWQPMIPPSEARKTASVFRELVEADGRDPDLVGLENVVSCGVTTGGPIIPFEEAAEIAQVSRDAGFTHMCISTMDAGHETIEDHLEYAAQWLRRAREA